MTPTERGKRRSIEIKKIEDRQQRNVAFSKRRPTVFNKAEELCGLAAEASGDGTSPRVAVIVFSPGNKPRTFGSPSVDSVVDQFLLEDESRPRGEGETKRRRVNPHAKRVEYWEECLKLEECKTLEDLEAKKEELTKFRDMLERRLSLSRDDNQEMMINIGGSGSNSNSSGDSDACLGRAAALLPASPTAVLDFSTEEMVAPPGAIIDGGGLGEMQVLANESMAIQEMIDDYLSC